jgi:transcriptional regulator with XRE-family HTH domain
MRSNKPILFPKNQKILQVFGENIKLARKRRKLTIIQIAERAGLNRNTVTSIEKGSPNVSIGAYFNILRAMNLQDDFYNMASDDEFGRKLQDLQLLC